MNINTVINAYHKLPAFLAGIILLAGTFFAIHSGLQGALADNPTFFFSTSASCNSPVTSLEVELGPILSLYVCIDGDNEGAGFLGAETYISYSSSALSVSSSLCDAFDTCVDLSELGMIRLLAASGPLPEGKAVTSQSKLAQLSINFSRTGSTNLNYTSVQIIDEDEEVETRNGLGIAITVVDEIGGDEEVPPTGGGGEEAPPTGGGGEGHPAAEEEPTGSVLSGLSITPISTTAAPGTLVQVISTAHYTEGRPSENVTSCFPCPTAGNPDVNGTITYNAVSGPGIFSGSKVAIDEAATPGSVITFNANFADNVSGTNINSLNRTITVVSEEEEEEEETPLSILFSILARPEGRPADIYDSVGTVNFYSTVTGTGFDGGEVDMDNSGSGELSIEEFPASTYYVSLKSTGYLKKYLRDIVIPEDTDTATLDYTLEGTFLLLGGDVYPDNVINSFDLAMILNNYLQADPELDLSRDGTVNAPDLTMVLKNYFKTGDSL
jgi:hypothetical protein